MFVVLIQFEVKENYINKGEKFFYSFVN